MNPIYYRGGPRLVPRPSDVRVERATGLVKPSRGLSVYDRPDHPNVIAHGGAYRVVAVPAGLVILKTCADPHHYEIIPAALMPFDQYAALLQLVVLVRV